MSDPDPDPVQATGLDDDQNLRAWAIDRAMGMASRGFSEHPMSVIAEQAAAIFAYVKDATIPPAPPEPAK